MIRIPPIVKMEYICPTTVKMVKGKLCNVYDFYFNGGYDDYLDNEEVHKLSDGDKELSVQHSKKWYEGKQTEIKQKIVDLHKEKQQSKFDRKRIKNYESYLNREWMSVEKMKQFEGTLHCKKINENGLITESNPLETKKYKGSTMWSFIVSLPPELSRKTNLSDEQTLKKVHKYVYQSMLQSNRRYGFNEKNVKMYSELHLNKAHHHVHCFAFQPESITPDQFITRKQLAKNTAARARYYLSALIPDFKQDDTTLTAVQKTFKDEMRKCIHGLVFDTKDYRNHNLSQQLNKISELAKEVKKDFRKNDIEFQWGRLIKQQYDTVEKTVGFDINEFKNNIDDQKLELKNEKQEVIKTINKKRFTETNVKSIYKQRPDATYILTKAQWEWNGFKLKDNAEAIVIKTPVYQDEQAYKGVQKLEYNKKLKIEVNAFVNALIDNKFNVTNTIKKFHKKSPIVVDLVERYISTGGNFLKYYLKSHRNNKALVNKILFQREIIKYDSIQEYDVKDVLKIERIKIKKPLLFSERQEELVLRINDLLRDISKSDQHEFVDKEDRTIYKNLSQNYKNWNKEVNKYYDSIKNSLDMGFKTQKDFKKVVNEQKKIRLFDMHTKLANTVLNEISKYEKVRKRHTCRMVKATFKATIGTLIKETMKVSQMIASQSIRSFGSLQNPSQSMRLSAEDQIIYGEESISESDTKIKHKEK